MLDRFIFKKNKSHRFDDLISTNMLEGFFKKKFFQGLKSVLGKCKTVNLRVSFCAKILFCRLSNVLFKTCFKNLFIKIEKKW